MAATIGIRGTHCGARLCHAYCVAITNQTAERLTDRLHFHLAEGVSGLARRSAWTLASPGTFGCVPNVRTLPQAVAPAHGVADAAPLSGVAPSAVRLLRSGRKTARLGGAPGRRPANLIRLNPAG